MDLSRWIRNSVNNIRTGGIYGVWESLYPVYKKALHQVFQLRKSGTPIFEYDWDLLIVLDGCRLDLMKEVSNEFNFVSDINRARSVDTMTREWMIKNFGSEYQDHMNETIYICGNPMSRSMLNEDDFLKLDEIWMYCWDDTLGTIPPRPITDSAISSAREYSPDRMIVHYMQPHYPFISYPDLDDGIELDEFANERRRNVWGRLRVGDVERSVVWNAYRENLQIVLEEVELLLENINAETAVITSDHGNALGEWGIYGHPIHMPIDAIQVVPWVQTKAEDRRNHDPSVIDRSSLNESAEKRLQQLGYRS
jgi:hypothetical protein